MKKSILKLLIVITITSLVLLYFTGCISPETTEFEESKSPEIAELEERIDALEEKLAKKDAEEATPEEEKSPPEIITDNEPTKEEEPGDEETGNGATDEEVASEGEPGDEEAGNEATDEEVASEGKRWNPERTPVEENRTIGIDLSQSGFTIAGEGTYLGAPLAYLGDWDNNEKVSAFFIFDISSIGPLDDYGPLHSIGPIYITFDVTKWINHPELGSKMIRMTAEGVEWMTMFFHYPPPFNQLFDSNELSDEFLKAIDADKQYFRIDFIPLGVSANGVKDYYQIHAITMELHYSWYHY